MLGNYTTVQCVTQWMYSVLHSGGWVSTTQYSVLQWMLVSHLAPRVVERLAARTPVVHSCRGQKDRCDCPLPLQTGPGAPAPIHTVVEDKRTVAIVPFLFRQVQVHLHQYTQL
eukprot:TRINITY_DN53617_c0_g1_i1.p1 TRINITY_DN53617_c0_g1~~TRINITY_DN53617_c0_g1_i1.p1  ORF type:complete len:113 (+),score=14.00 TRINITY_DN53617_c0_g1_i1:82-420(+)